MKYKQKVDTAVALILILIGTILLILPLYKIDNIKSLSIIVFSLYSIISIIQFFLTKKSKDYEGLHTFLASLVGLVCCIIFKVQNDPSKLAMTLMVWIGLMSLTKLKKTDYYHDRKDRMWKLHAVILAIFILVGLLTCINLYFETMVQVIVFGFFMLIHGILELFEPVVKTLIAHS